MNHTTIVTACALAIMLGACANDGTKVGVAANGSSRTSTSLVATTSTTTAPRSPTTTTVAEPRFNRTEVWNYVTLSPPAAGVQPLHTHEQALAARQAHGGGTDATTIEVAFGRATNPGGGAFKGQPAWIVDEHNTSVTSNTGVVARMDRVSIFDDANLAWLGTMEGLPTG